MNDLIIQANQTMEMSKIFASSSIIPLALRNKPADVFIIIQFGLELGLKPMQSLSSIYVVNGRPTVSSQLMMGLIYRDFCNAIINIRDHFDKDGKFEFVTVEMKRNAGHDGRTVRWDLNRASVAGLRSKDVWQKYPQQMCQWRAVSDCAKAVFPELCLGLYIKDEAEEMNDEDEKTPRIAINEADIKLGQELAKEAEATASMPENNNLSLKMKIQKLIGVLSSDSKKIDNLLTWNEFKTEHSITSLKSIDVLNEPELTKLMTAIELCIENMHKKVQLDNELTA